MPPLVDDPIGAPRPFRVGADLRAARERLGWELPAIAARLRVRPAVLAAIEAGRMAELPPGAYALGHLRSYARVLGLDPDEVVRRFRAEAAGATRTPRLSFPAPVPERGVPAGAVVLLGALLAVGAYAGWYQVSGSRRGEEPVRLAPQRLADMVRPPPAPPSSPASSPAPAPEPAASVAEAEPPAPDLPAVPPSSAAAAIPAAGVFGLKLGAPPAAALPPLPEGTRIVIRAKADAWLQVRERQGAVLLNRVLHPGETWPVPVQKTPGQFVMTTGNAGGTELLVDGQVAPPLGPDGAVRRDLALDPEAARDGRLGPAAPAKPP